MRGINRQTIFEEDDDCIRFLETLKKYKENDEYQIYAYCLMGNHIHLLLREEKEELGLIMRRIGASYVYWYNCKYDRVGHLFQDRYKSEAIEDDRYLLTVLRYIHRNPVKAGMVKHIKDYQWSSYSEYIHKSSIIDRDFVLNLFNHEEETAINSFQEYHEINDEGACLDIDESRRISDNEAREIIKKICGIDKCTDIQNLDNEKRNRYLKSLRKTGISTRQLARLTGINRNIILKL